MFSHTLHLHYRLEHSVLLCACCSRGSAADTTEAETIEEGSGAECRHSGDAALPPELEAELVDTELDADAGAEGDQLENGHCGDEDGAHLPYAVALTLLEHAAAVVEAYNRGGPFHLPSALTSEDRQALHVLAEELGLSHESEGVCHGRHLVISKVSTTASAVAAMEGDRMPGVAPDVAGSGPSEGCEQDWATRRVKYDPRHW